MPPKWGLFLGSAGISLQLNGFEGDFFRPEAAGGHIKFRETLMRRILALALLALALTGGVAAVTALNLRPALAGCTGNDC